MSPDGPEGGEGAGAQAPRTVHRRVLDAMLAVGLLTALVKAAGLGKEVVVANRFGSAPALDAYRIAQSIPDFAMNVVAGSLNAALIPVYVELRERRGADAAAGLLSAVAGLSLSVLLLSSLALALLLPWLVPVLGNGFEPETLRLTMQLSLLLLPIVVLSGLNVSWGAVLNAHDHFALPAALPMLAHFFVIALLLAGPQHWGVFAMAVGTLAGLSVELLVLGGGLRRESLPLRPRFGAWSEPVRRVLREWGLLAGGLVVSAGALLVDRGMAASLPPGSVARLDYGNKLVAGLLTVGVYALATPMLPHFSRLVAHRDWSEVRRTLRRFTRLTLLAGLPGTLILIVLSRPLVRLLFERGAFTAADTEAVTLVQQLYLLQAPGYVLMMLAARLLLSLNRNRTLLFVSVGALLLNVIGNLVFMRLLGLPGIALSTALVQTATALALFAVLRSCLPRTGEAVR